MCYLIYVSFIRKPIEFSSSDRDFILLVYILYQEVFLKSKYSGKAARKEERAMETYIEWKYILPGYIAIAKFRHQLEQFLGNLLMIAT